MVGDVIHSSLFPNVTMSKEVLEATEELRVFLNDNVYYNEVSYREFKKAYKLLQELYQYFGDHPEQMGTELLDPAKEQTLQQRVCDFIAGMTDRYALKAFEDIFLPKPWLVY
jgi:dGTPase